MVTASASTDADPLLSENPAALLEMLARRSNRPEVCRPESALPAAILADAFVMGGLSGQNGLIEADPALSSSRELGDAVAHHEIALHPDRPALSFISRDDFTPLVVVTLPLRHAAHWALASTWAQRHALNGITHLILIHRALLAGGTLVRAARMLGLTQREAALIATIARTGDLRKAATSEAISYETARGAVKSALAKTGFRRQGALVATALQLDALDDPSPIQLGDHLQQALGINDRQVALARLIALGSTRREAAQALGMGHETAKTELRILFQLLGVSSSAGLSVLAAQLGIAARLFVAPDIGTTDIGAASEPLRLIPRTNGRPGRIAFADYGPKGHSPAIHFHTATTSRYYPRSYIAQLQRRGFRPVMIDRPGYGFTDLIGGDYTGEAARDTLDVADHLGAEHFHVIARGGTLVLAQLANEHRHRLLRAVVLNPEPAPDKDARRSGIVGAYKRIFYTLPRLIGPLTRYLASRISDTMIEQIARRMLGPSAADQQTFAEPEVRRAYVYASRLAAIQGGAGLEALSMAEMRGRPAPIIDGSFITILSGEEDAMYSARDSWPRLLACWPGARAAIVPGAGRLLHLQRPDLVAAALNDRSHVAIAPSSSR